MPAFLIRSALLALVAAVVVVPLPALAHNAEPPSATEYVLYVSARACPNLPVGTHCTLTSPTFQSLEMEVDNASDTVPVTPTGRFGPPVELQLLQCVNATTVNSSTTVHLGTAAVFYHEVGSFQAGALAGILSPDTPATSPTDAHSVAFVSIAGSYSTPSVTTRFSIHGLYVVNNTISLAIRGRLTVAVTGTLLNYTYSNGTYNFTGYSQGRVMCAVTPHPLGSYQEWIARNSLYALG